MQTRMDVSRAARAVSSLVQLPRLLRLYWRLLRDGRVPWWPKAVLAGALVYVATPIDLIPDVVPILGRLDDLTLLLVVARLFLSWCPAEVVAGHARALGVRLPA